MRNAVVLSLLALTGCNAGHAARLHYEPAPSPLTEAYGITPEESARRLNNEQYVGELNARLHEGALPYFSDLWIQHEPRYAIVIAFTRLPPLGSVQQLANRSIRSNIVLVKAQRTMAEIARDRDRAVAAIRGAPGTWGGGYNPKSGKFEFDVQNQAVADYARSRLPPDLADDVVFRITGNILRAVTARER